MTINTAQNNIGHLKDTLNEKRKVVERYKKTLIEVQQNIGQKVRILQKRWLPK